MTQIYHQELDGGQALDEVIGDWVVVYGADFGGGLTAFEMDLQEDLKSLVWDMLS